MQLLWRPSWKPSGESHPQSRDVSSRPRSREELVDSMVQSERWALLLRPALVKDLQASQLQPALDAFRDNSAYVPGGPVLLDRWWIDEDEPGGVAAPRDRFEVEDLFLDRCVVTNRQYQCFVDQRGYHQQSLWNAAVWPRVVEFVDSSGEPAPRFWSAGRHPPSLGDHPVVGVSWFEAEAYARWVGRRLPTDAEWVKAACWPIATDGEPLQRKYPWGDTYDPSQANLFSSGLAGTCPVEKFPSGDSVGGIRQMMGNVWEWTANNVQISAWSGELDLEGPLKSLRGGAFDAYFETHVSCQLQSGDNPLARKRNIGFRCCVGASELADVIQAAAHPDSPTATVDPS